MLNQPKQTAYAAGTTPFFIGNLYEVNPSIKHIEAINAECFTEAKDD
jgi:hypothetical protein